MLYLRLLLLTCWLVEIKLIVVIYGGVVKWGRERELSFLLV